MASYDYPSLVNGIDSYSAVPEANGLLPRIRTDIHDESGRPLVRQATASHSHVLRVRYPVLSGCPLSWNILLPHRLRLRCHRQAMARPATAQRAFVYQNHLRAARSSRLHRLEAILEPRSELKIPSKKAIAHVNLLVSGGAGLGKTTFIKQFFHEFAPENFVPHDGLPTLLEKFRREGGPASLCAHLPDGIPTQSEEYQIFYHLQDTPGHNGLNIAEVKDLVVKHVQSEKEAHYRLRMERQSDVPAAGADANAEARNDRLFDLCLYFIPPQSFTQQDVDFITELSKEIMVIPVCAKADAMTNAERVAFHEQVKSCLAAEGITYGLVEEEIGEAARAIGITTHTGPLDGPPFVMVTSNTYKQIGAELQPVRSYPWGDCVVTDPKHSDFALIREFVTTSAFHKLRGAKKRHFKNFVRARMAHSWENKQDPRAPTKLEATAGKAASTEEMDKLSQELRRVKAELESERQRTTSIPSVQKLSVSSSGGIGSRTPSDNLIGSIIRTPEKSEMRSKSGLFSRGK